MDGLGGAIGHTRAAAFAPMLPDRASRCPGDVVAGADAAAGPTPGAGIGGVSVSLII